MSDSLRHDEVRNAPEAVPRTFVLRVLFALVTISVTLCIVAYLLLRLREGQLRPSGRFPERLLVAPHQVAAIRQAPFDATADAPTLADRQRAELDSWSWVDAQKRVARIPIREAMELTMHGARP